MARDPSLFRLRTLLPAALCCLALPALAAPPAAESASEATATVAGMKVGIDPKTGKLRPLTPTESAQIERVLGVQSARAGAARVGVASAPSSERGALDSMRALPGGGQAMKAPASAISELTVRRADDGRFVVGHAGDAHETHAHDTAKGGEVHE